MGQYFENDSSVASKEKFIIYEINGVNISLITDNGVFSKNRVDEGSLILLKTLIPLHLSGKILDLGCGYGPIGLTLAMFSPEARVDLAEINTRALALAKRNAERLNLSQRVNCLQSDIYKSVEGPYDSIVVNPPIRAGKKVTWEMYAGAKQLLVNGGSLYIVIRKAQGAESASQYIKEVFGNITLLNRKKGYLVYQASKES